MEFILALLCSSVTQAKDHMIYLQSEESFETNDKLMPLWMLMKSKVNLPISEYIFRKDNKLNGFHIFINLNRKAIHFKIARSNFAAVSSSIHISNFTRILLLSI